MVKVLFVYHNDIEEAFMPQPIAVLGGVAREQGAQTRFFDTSFFRDKNSTFTENDRKTRENTGEYKRVEGYDPERKVVDIKDEFMQAVETFRPDLIAATSTSYEFSSMLDFVTPAKKRFKVPVIVGGAHPTVAPEKAIQMEGVDMLCVGEGEIAFSKLLQAMSQGKDISGIKNLWIKTKKGIIRNSLGPYIDMDDIPEPDWDLIDPRHRVRPFEGELMNYGFWEISRGCPNTCSYCINDGKNGRYREAGIHSKAFRFHSPKEIVRRMAKFKSKYRFNHIHLIDDNIAVMPLRDLEELAELYKQNVGVGFFTMGRPEPLAAHPRKLEILADMGCKMIAYGAESGDEGLRRTVLNRPMKEGVLERAALLAKDNGIKVCLFSIIGFPEETEEMIFKTLELNRRIQPDSYSVRFLHPYPGTAINDYCVKHRYIAPGYEETTHKSFLMEPVLDLPSPPHPTKEQLMDYKRNFGRYIRMPEDEFSRLKEERLGK